MTPELDAIKNSIGDFAKDIRLNFSTVLTPAGSPDLTQAQIYSVALASAYALSDRALIDALEAAALAEAGEAQVQAAKTATSLMAMNNIYYRFNHSVENAAVTSLPAKLRMQGIATHGIAKVDFELMSLAVSAIHGCAMCMNAHTHELVQAGATPLAVQSSVRIASVIHATVRARALS
jgi:alkyl hydroperoxide reductase subunit D